MERCYMPKSNCAQIFMPVYAFAGFLQIGEEITLVCSKFGEQRRVHGRLKKIDYAWRQLVLDCGVVDADAVVAIE